LVSIIPPPIKKGDEVRIISTARKISMDEIKPASDFFKAKGFKVSFGKHLFKKNHQFAGTDEERIRDIQEAMDDPKVKAIWLARGGYGTHRVIENLSIDEFRKNPKWIVGYSDVTVLHSFILSQCNSASIHGTMPVNFTNQTRESFEKLISMLQGNVFDYKIKPHSFNRNGIAKGILTGGNLSIIYSLTGTKFLPDFKNKILFIEDLDEYLYHVDRMMMNLKLSGIFDEISGLIIGGMSDMNDNEIPFGKTANEIIQSTTEGYDFPVCFGFRAGHQKINLPLKFGCEVGLKVTNKGSELSFN